MTSTSAQALAAAVCVCTISAHMEGPLLLTPVRDHPALTRPFSGLTEQGLHPEPQVSVLLLLIQGQLTEKLQSSPHITTDEASARRALSKTLWCDRHLLASKDPECPRLDSSLGRTHCFLLESDKHK